MVNRLIIVFAWLAFAPCGLDAQDQFMGGWVGFSTDDGRMYGGPDPDNPTQLLDVLKRNEFHAYLKITEDQKRQISDLLRSSDLPTIESIDSSDDPALALILFAQVIDDRIRSIISESQYARLRHLCYRIEIGILGFPNSLALKRSLEKMISLELSPPQRTKLTETIGNYFEYRPSASYRQDPNVVAQQ